MRLPTDANNSEKPIINNRFRERRELIEMKKILITLAVIGILIVGAAAFAHGGYSNKGFNGTGCDAYGSRHMRAPGYHMGHGYEHMWRGETDVLRRSGPGHHWSQGRNFPSDMIAKMNEIEKLHLQMRMEFFEEEPDREKLMELHNRIQDLRREMADWHFREYLERLGNKPVKVQ